MKGFTILLLLSVAFCVQEYAKEENVVVLTDDTFDKFISAHDHVLVKFYAPWCGHCKKLAPEYSKAALTLEKEGLILAQVDATAQKKLAEKYQIQGYPTLKLFSKGQVIEYNAGRTEKDIVTWMRKKTGPVLTELKSEEQVEKFKKDAEVSVVFFGDDEKLIKVFEGVARKNEDFVFGLCKDNTVAGKYNAKKNTVVLFKAFDEGRNDLTSDLTEGNINKFINGHSSPLVMTFDEKCAQLVFGKNVPAIVLYMDKASPKKEEYEKLMRSVAKDYLGVLQFVVTDIKEGLKARLAEYIGVKNEDLPTVRIADTRVDLKKYNLEGQISEASIKKFIKDWQDKKLKPFLKSQDPPKEQKDPVYKLVGKTFDDIVIKSDKDVLVKFYAPWCGHCKALAPTYIDLAKKLKNNKDLLIAEIDATENEVESVYITGFPTIKFWPAGKKNKPLDYNGGRTLEEFTKYLKEHCTHKLVIEEDKTEEKKEDKKEAKKDAKKGGKKSDL